MARLPGSIPKNFPSTTRAFSGTAALSGGAATLRTPPSARVDWDASNRSSGATFTMILVASDRFSFLAPSPPVPRSTPSVEKGRIKIGAPPLMVDTLRWISSSAPSAMFMGSVSPAQPTVDQSDPVFL